MEWLKMAIEQLFKKNKIKMLEAGENIKVNDDKRNDFLVDLKNYSNVEINDGNGYGILTDIKLEDMI